ncbi:MAG TPA: ATP-binding protein [Gaiellaceae bacterium]|nr:ATP-binding protein [Gaiellaceae bacterium]
MRVLVAALLATDAALLGGTAALRLAAGGIGGQALAPATLALILTAFGCVILAQRPDLGLGQLLVVSGLGSAVGTLGAAALEYGSTHPLPRLAMQAAFATVWLTTVLIATWTQFILCFPDGRLPGGAWRRFYAAAAAICTAVGLGGWLAGPADTIFAFYGHADIPAGAAGPWAGTLPVLGRLNLLLLLLPLAALASLVQRYRRGGPVVRQQVRWLLVGMTTQVVCQILGAALEPHGARDVGVALSVGSQPLPIVGATVAILRYRLWEIDLVVSRALVWGVLWAGLSGLLLVPALAAGLLVGGRGALTAVAIALLVTAAFQPARTRLERLAERIVFRHRARPRDTLSAFWETLRTTDADRIGPLLADVARGTLGVGWAAAWSHRDGVLRPLAVSGAPAGAAGLLPPAVAERLLASPGLVLAGPPPRELAALWPEPPAAVVPLVAGDELVGVLACGDRRGDALGPGDFELLELLARPSALRLRNLRLEGQLRERLAEIEAQAEELRRSRQRLVTAQDEERRRIERDLHDGVQQQLVSLAVRLQRLAVDAEPERARLLRDLASEAEQAVFAVQELARGIFPSVLADQGLTAALRTQAARMPLAVRVEADDRFAGRRLDPELEAALYFVALEALTNVQKHAPGASALLRLRGGERSIEVEVCDDGPGLAPGAGGGSGLQNMADRVAAAGGSFAVDAPPGGGTRVAARLPLAAQVAEPLPVADSRR